MNNYQQNYVQRPIGVSILAVLYFIGGFINSILGLIVIVTGAETMNFFGKIAFIYDMRASAGLIIFAGVVLIGIAVLLFFIGTGLLKLRNWARITVIVFQSVSIVFTLIGVVASLYVIRLTISPFLINLISLLISVGIIVYLCLKNVRSCFDGQRRNDYAENEYDNEDYGQNDYPAGDHGRRPPAGRNPGRERRAPRPEFHNDEYPERGRRRGSAPGGRARIHGGDAGRRAPMEGSAPSLLITSGYQSGKRIRLISGQNTVGRGNEASILLPDPQKRISRQHLLIDVRGGQCTIRNISRTNALHINGRKVNSAVLYNNDSIRIGNYEFTFNG